MDLIYKLSSTNFDLIYLEHACTFCWFTAGATLIRCLKVSSNQGDIAESEKLSQEIGVIK